MSGSPMHDEPPFEAALAGDALHERVGGLDQRFVDAHDEVRHAAQVLEASRAAASSAASGKRASACRRRASCAKARANPKASASSSSRAVRVDAGEERRGALGERLVERAVELRVRFGSRLPAAVREAARVAARFRLLPAATVLGAAAARRAEVAVRTGICSRAHVASSVDELVFGAVLGDHDLALVGEILGEI